MLTRYKIRYMEKIPADAPEASGIRVDTRKHTRHCLRPSIEMVERYQAGGYSWADFVRDYQHLIASRFAEDSIPFDDLAARAMEENVFIGCSCPTKKNPDVNQCHTVLALQFMHEHYPHLDVVFPKQASDV